MELRLLDEELVWRWMVRITIIGLILWWAAKGLEPSERWIGLIVILLGGTNFLSLRKKDSDEGSNTKSVVKNSGNNDEGHKGISKCATLHPNRCPLVVEWCF